jgi:PhnB protein
MPNIKTSIAPWLSVKNSATAAAFYKAAFGAVEVYRYEEGNALVLRLSVDGAEFWLSGASGGDEITPEVVGGETVRMILTVADPDALFARALQAGATEIFPVGEEYGWRLGRLVDPLGLHWELGHEL